MAGIIDRIKGSLGSFVKGGRHRREIGLVEGRVRGVDPDDRYFTGGLRVAALADAEDASDRRVAIELLQETATQGGVARLRYTFQPQVARRLAEMILEASQVDPRQER